VLLLKCCQSVVVPVRPDVKSVSRELNVVMFGVAENRDRNVWRDMVSRVEFCCR